MGQVFPRVSFLFTQTLQLALWRTMHGNIPQTMESAMTITEYLYAVFEPAITFVQGISLVHVLFFLIIFGSFAFMAKR